MSEPPSTSAIAILGVSDRTIYELDSFGIMVESVGEDFMVFNWNPGITTRETERFKMIIKQKVGHQCRISYVPPTGQPELLILKRKYLV